MDAREKILESAKGISASPGSLAIYIRELVLAGFFDSPAQSRDVVRAAKERFGRRFPVAYVQTYMKPFLEAGILRARALPGKGNLWYGAWLPEANINTRRAAERLRISIDTTGWSPEIAEDFQLALACFSSELWKPAAVMIRRAYEGALTTKFKSIEKRDPDKEGTCPKCATKMGKRPMSITDLHYWAVAEHLVREKMDGLSVLLKDLGAGGAHPTKTRVIDPDTAEIIVRCGAVLLREMYSRRHPARRAARRHIPQVQTIASGELLLPAGSS